MHCAFRLLFGFQGLLELCHLVPVALPQAAAHHVDQLMLLPFTLVQIVGETLVPLLAQQQPGEATRWYQRVPMATIQEVEHT